MTEKLKDKIYELERELETAQTENEHMRRVLRRITNLTVYQLPFPAPGDAPGFVRLANKQKELALIGIAKVVDQKELEKIIEGARGA